MQAILLSRRVSRVFKRYVAKMRERSQETAGGRRIVARNSNHLAPLCSDVLALLTGDPVPPVLLELEVEADRARPLEGNFVFRAVDTRS
jgi:hypothetical protein